MRRKPIHKMTAAELRVLAQEIRALNPHDPDRLQSYRNVTAALRRAVGQ